MSKRVILLLVYFLIFLCLSINTSLGENVNDTIDRLLAAEYVEGEVIVKFKDEIAVNQQAMVKASAIAHSKTGAIIKKEFKGLRGVQLVKLPGHKSIRQALESYLMDTQVEYAEPNYIVHTTVTPNDPYFNQLWGLNNTGQSGGTIDADIDAPEAWVITTGSDNVVIAVVDTGVAYNHPDLSSNIWINTGETSCTDGIDNDNNGYIDDCYGWDFIGDDNDPTDYNGHGTHVAGTIAAVGNNSAGITGVMWKAKIMPLRFLGVSGSGSTDNAISAILYANAKSAHVINNSWGGNGYSQALKDAIDASSAVVVCAAGNDGADNDTTPFYPASYTSSNIISVAATDSNDNLASFSNYGLTSVDVGAPGVWIYSTVPQFTYGPAVTLLSENFDGASGSLPFLGWDRGGANATWAVTTGTGVSGTNSLEDSPGKSYRNSTDSWAGYMTPFTSVKDNLYTLSFRWKGVLETNYDYLLINFSSDGVYWDWLDYRTGSTNGSFISDSTDEITAAADLLSSFYLGFGLYSDLTITYDGVYLDNVALTRKPITIGSYSYASYQGTSMAAPHVSGLAGLIKAFGPTLSNLEIKNAILDNVDVKSSLSGKILTAGRINALQSTSDPDIDYDGDGYSVNQGDCKDNDPAVNPEATEILCNGKDDDCNPSTLDIRVDLYISSVTAPSSAATGSTISVSDTTNKSGPCTTDTSTTKFYLSTDSAYSSGDTELGSRAVPAFGTGSQSSSSTTSVTIPTSTSAGSYYLIARADADGVTTETNEGNNNRDVSIAITSNVDLYISTVTALGSATAGQTISVSDTTNKNGIGIAGTSTTRIYFSTDNKWWTNDTELGSRAVPTFGSGAGSSSSSTDVTIPTNTCTKTYYLIAKADANGNVSEWNEGNNNRAISIAITRPDPSADLYISSVTAPGSANAGDTITVSDTTNKSGCAAGASTTRVYLSKYSSGYGGIEIGSGRAVPAFSSNPGTQTNSGSISGTIPSGGCTGSCYIVVKADADGAITETNEGNNKKAVAITINQ